MTVISTCISDEDYNKMLKQALRDELESIKAQEKELIDSINTL